MTRYVEHSSNKVRAVFGEPLEHDDGEEFVFGSNNLIETNAPATMTSHEKDIEAGKQHDFLVSIGYGPGALIARKSAREQVKNPWTWGIVMFLTKALHRGDICPLGVLWLSDGANRSIAHVKSDEVFLVAAPPPAAVLNALLGAV